MIIMSKTYTPELTPEVLDRLEDYADVFRDDFSHKKQAGWFQDRGRLNEAGVPEAFRQSKAKGTIALELLDTVRGEGLPGWLALADAGYGVSEEFRNGLAARGLKYIVGVTDEMVVFTEEPQWERPEPAGRTGGPPR